MPRKKEEVKEIKKTRFPIWILIVIAIVLCAILLWRLIPAIVHQNQNKSQEGPFGWNISEESGGKKETLKEEKGLLENIGDSVKKIFSGGGGGGAGGAGGGVPSGGGSITYTTDLTICTNAQSSGLCDGLNLAYGEGYKAACCSERNLCC